MQLVSVPTIYYLSIYQRVRELSVVVGTFDKTAVTVSLENYQLSKVVPEDETWTAAARRLPALTKSAGEKAEVADDQYAGEAFFFSTAKQDIRSGKGMSEAKAFLKSVNSFRMLNIFHERARLSLRDASLSLFDAAEKCQNTQLASLHLGIKAFGDFLGNKTERERGRDLFLDRQGLIEADLTTAVTVAANKTLRSMLLHATVGQP
ncbi:hypothetical protein D9C73_010838 [Collichthys lucidus]|uniref:Uncharacterized protein n=1 Tax=Collichthys lucidus TaxID=240159 RepID=A0A4U5UQ86_COLLU|nr:hypothetical protein D9C73_010838 [Collichthys lucidus]